MTQITSPFPATALPVRGTLRAWLLRHRELLWAALLVLVAAVAHGYNLSMFPYFESDEGTYMSQAWSLLRLRELAPYTYWYDHSPGGWAQIALWSALTGGFYRFGPPVVGGRVLILLMHIGSLAMVYRIARTVSRSPVAATIAVLTFGFSAYGLYYGRRVLLDNIATFWMLLSIVLIIGRNVTLSRVWMSAAALGIAILSKELTIFLLPVLAFLVWHQVRGPQRWLATCGWLALVGAIFSIYPLLAILKGELFPTGTWLGGTSEHVSLLGSLEYQSSRQRDAGLLDWNSVFWQAVRRWSVEEPLLLIGGSAAMGVTALLLPWRRRIGVLALATISLWLFIGRGGVTLPFYLVPLLPLLAINLGVLCGLVVDGARALLARFGTPGVALATMAQAGAVLAVLAVVPLGYRNPNLEFGSDPLVLWRSRQAEVFTLAANWAINNLPRTANIVIDQSMYLELRDNPASPQPFANANYYWKVLEDPEIRDDVLRGDWRNIDYIITTNQLIGDTDRTSAPIMAEPLRNSVVIRSFDTGGWPIKVLKVKKPTTIAAESNPILRQSWDSYKQRFIQDGRVVDLGAANATTSEGQSYALWRAVYMNDRAAFDSVWRWTQANLQVRDDGLMAWKYGQREDGSTGVIDTGSAADAEQDTAFALLLASKRWNDGSYADAARKILAGIWQQQTTLVNGKRVLVAGDWARGENGGTPIVNPSYFAPYAYRIFAEADPERNWLELVDSSYALINAMQAQSPGGLVPNWAALDPATGTPRPATEQFGPYAAEYSYDAVRVPFRLGMDWLWNQEPRAKAALGRFSALREAYTRSGRIVAAYDQAGKPLAEYESLAGTATLLPALMATDSAQAERLFNEKLLGSYATDNLGVTAWGDQNNYYDQNWAFFAATMFDGGMSNLWQGQRVQNWRK